MYFPNCQFCTHYDECVVVKEIKQLREDIFNINREKAGRDTFILNGKLVKIDKDEQEEPLGEWIKTGEFFDYSFLMESWKCSSCGIEVIASEPYYNINLWHYCPNCGNKKGAVKREK